MFAQSNAFVSGIWSTEHLFVPVQVIMHPLLSTPRRRKNQLFALGQAKRSLIHHLSHSHSTLLHPFRFPIPLLHLFLSPLPTYSVSYTLTTAITRNALLRPLNTIPVCQNRYLESEKSRQKAHFPKEQWQCRSRLHSLNPILPNASCFSQHTLCVSLLLQQKTLSP